MRIKTILVVILVICLAIIIIWYPFREDVADKYYCKSSLDCVPSQCCHPNSCIHKAFSPDCREVLCSVECAPNTLDCNQGSCQCINNKCQAIIQNTGA